VPTSILHKSGSDWWRDTFSLPFYVQLLSFLPILGLLPWVVKPSIISVANHYKMFYRIIHHVLVVSSQAQRNGLITTRFTSSMSFYYLHALICVLG